jgi:hypothetical protein
MAYMLDLQAIFFAFRHLEFSQEKAKYHLAEPDYMQCLNPTDPE